MRRCHITLLRPSTRWKICGVYEYSNGELHYCFKMSNRGEDRLNQLLARGIPLEQAKKLFYQMDGK